MEQIIIKCEVLKLDTKEIWSYNEEILETDELYNLFQNSNNPIELGFIFERIWEEPVNNDENNIFIDNG